MSTFVYGGEQFLLKDTENNKYLLTIVQDEYPESPREWNSLGKMICWHNRYRLGDEHTYSEPSDFVTEIILKYVLPKDFLAFCKSNNLEKPSWSNINIEYCEQLFSNADNLEKANSEDIDLLDTYNELITAIYIKNHRKVHELLYSIQDIALLPLYLYDHSGITVNTTGFSCQWDSGQVGFIYIEKEKYLGNTVISEPDWKDKALEYLKYEVKEYDAYLTGEVYCTNIEEIVKNDDGTEEIGDLVGGCNCQYTNVFEDMLDEQYTIIKQIKDVVSLLDNIN